MTSNLYSLNCSITLQDLPLLDMPGRARDLGYRLAELWWPFGGDVPSSGVVDDLVNAARKAEVTTVLLNFPGGGPAVENRGLICVPGYETEVVEAARLTVSIGRRLGTRFYNPMMGNTTDMWEPGSQAFDTAVANLRRIHDIVGEAGGTIVVEPLSGFSQASVRTLSDATTLLDAVRAEGVDNIGLLLDLYHVARNGEEMALETLTVADVAHVQVADDPGRGWPGTGRLPLGAWIDQLRSKGYEGLVGFECVGQPLTCDQVDDILTR